MVLAVLREQIAGTRGSDTNTSVAMWYVFLDHLYGLTYERLGIRPLLIDKLNDYKNRSPMTLYR